MANGSNNSSELISLPKGGGAQHGLGEKFSPDLHTGTGNFTVPIALPPGRNGFQPQLNLVYSTGNGNGPFGLGWSLSVPGVSRKTSKGIPRFDDLTDVFILSGAEDLVRISGSYPGSVRYRPRTEGLFALIDHIHDSGNDYWEVKSKDGLVSRYGTPGQSGSDAAMIAKPDNRSKVFAWKLTLTTDPFDNRIEYDYERDMATDGPHIWDQLYLKQIRYADYKMDEMGATQFLVYVKFTYEDRLDDPFSEYRSGFEIRTRRRCASILIETHADRVRSVREYRLTYEKEPLTAISLLKEINVVGFDDDNHPYDGEVHDGALRPWQLPPLEFGYTRFEPEGRKFALLTGSDLPAQSLASQDLDLIDLHGNGLPDILEMNGAVRYWRNMGSGRFDLPRPMKEAPAGMALAAVGVQLLDANGDGRTDLMVSGNSLAGYFPLEFPAKWSPKSFQKYEEAPSFNLEDPEVRLMDLTGDGVTDAIRSGTRLECFFNDPHEGWLPHNTRWVERQRLDIFPNVSFSDPRVKLADMTGDGLQDIVLVYDGNVEYWPNRGYGNWGKRIHMSNSPRLPYGYDPKRILIGDVDGDGLADFVYVGDREVYLYLNQSGNSWSQRIRVQGTPPVTDFDSVRLVDLLGTGVSGVLWSSDRGTLGPRNYMFLDFTGGVKPYLLNEMNNHMGAITRVAYKPSTTFYLEDEKKRETRWKTSLPFPVQVVARVEVIDQFSRGKLTTEYRYHQGHWDGGERERRGFGRVDQLDTQTYDDYHAAGLHGDSEAFQNVALKYFSPPTMTKTWFHVGPVGEEFGEWQELDWSNEYWPGDPQRLKHTESVNQYLKDLEAATVPSRITRRAKRDALRALRGSILRTELYALDGATNQDRPYTVTEHAYRLREEVKPGDDEEDRLRIFFPYPVAQRTTQWERGDDPMTLFSFTGDYDDVGQARSQTAVACPRGWRDLSDRSNEYLATRTRTAFNALPNGAPYYIRDRVAKATSYEIINNASRTILQMRDLPDSDPAHHVIGQTLNFYDGLAFQGLPYGQIGKYGALVKTETLVLTEEILRESYKNGRVVSPTPEIPAYMDPSGTATWSSEYPQQFIDSLPLRGGYTFRPGGAASEYQRGYFAVSESRKYDFHTSPSSEGQGLLIATRDPLENETSIEFDTYNILPKTVTDAVGLTTKADYDYRVIQPKLVTDPNHNETRVTFTPLGLPKDTWVMGNPAKTEGDRQRPSVTLEYDFLATFKRGDPISVRTVRQLHHDTETDVPVGTGAGQRDETIETREYSDGFGRLLQTRTQAEDVIFGDENFGDNTLPEDQTNETATRQAITGKHNTNSAAPNVVVSGWQHYNNKGWMYDEADSTSNAQTFWEALPALSGATLIGAVPYTITDGNSKQRYIFLFAIKGQKLLFVRFNLDLKQQQVDSDATEVDVKLPDGATAFTGVIKQRATDSQPPCVVLHSAGGAIYLRYLNQEGNDWEAGTWRLLVDQDESESFARLHAVVGYEDEWFYIVVAGKDGSLQFKLLHGYSTALYLCFAQDTFDYFWTTSKAERDSAVASGNYRSLGITGYVSTRQIEGTVPLYRFRNGKHAYTSKESTRQQLLSQGLISEGIEGYVFQSQLVDTVPINKPVTLDGFVQPKEWQRIAASSWIGGLRLGATKTIFIFWREGATRNYRSLAPGPTFGESLTIPFEVNNIAAHSCSGVPLEEQRIAYSRTGALQKLLHSVIRQQAAANRIIESLSPEQMAAPDYAGPLDICNRMLTDHINAQVNTHVALAVNEAGPQVNLEYLEEIFYFVPVHIALQFQRSGDYVLALDCLRVVYDYTAPISQRKLQGLREPAGPGKSYERDIGNWLLDPLNPHGIAQTRPNAYKRFTFLSITKCVLDYADSEYTLDTTETVPRARELYELALEFLDSSELRQNLNACDKLIGELKITVDDSHWEWIELEAKRLLRQISDVGEIKRAIEKMSHLGSGTAVKKYGKIQSLFSDLSETNSDAVLPFGDVVNRSYAKMPEIESALLSNPALARALEATLTVARTGRHTVADLVKTPSVFNFCVPANPVLRSLRMRAELNLYKIRNCRNIVGMQRQLEPFAAPTDTTSGMPAIGGGQLVLPAAATIPPTQYRYAALIDRAKQLVQQAVQLESAFLAALEKSDKEAFDLLTARANVRLAQAGVKLEDLRLVEAQDGVAMAGLQRDRASIQANTYEDWLSQGYTDSETKMMELYGELMVAQFIAGGANMILEAAQAGQINAYLGAVGAIKGTADFVAASLQTQIQQYSLMASYERRVQEVSLQKALADQDIQIGEQQIQLANDRVQIVGQERSIEQMKADNAKEVLDFLSNKFTNKDLYDWMSGVLQGVYSYFLQQATSVAQLAASEVAFERQEVLPRIIQNDYWEAPADDSSGSTQDGKAPDRRGLTGSARLLQDIYQLDQYAFEKNQRKQQLTKIISLAQLDPIAFQRFRENGILPFTTQMDLFDRDFPGHYLRLIKRVRMSVIALIPPTDGIRATLTCSGLSRVVIGGDLFQTTIIRRQPETVALSAALNATGLFDLQEQTELLAPHENDGVAMSWEFALPKAANRFDYSTIADVLMTIDYTALNRFDYRQEVIQLLNSRRTISADRAFSFRNQFADAWYDLNNPDKSSTPMSVSFQTQEEDFPPNVDNVRIDHISVYFARRPGKNVEFETVDLRFQLPGGGSLGGISRTDNGLVSTRSAAGSGWLGFRDTAPFGTWQLMLPDAEQTRLWFGEGDLTDILFVITYAGRLPEWPT